MKVTRLLDAHDLNGVETQIQMFADRSMSRAQCVIHGVPRDKDGYVMTKTDRHGINAWR